MKSLKIYSVANFPKKKILGDRSRKKGGAIMMVRFNLLQQNISVELHMIEMLKQFSLQLGEAGAAS